jgi:GT2 family glycosyltransferase
VISVVIVSYNTRAQTLACINSIAEFSAQAPELIVVDNASADGTADAVREAFPAVKVIAESENHGFARGCNIGARAGSGDLLAFVNSDCRFESDVLGRLAQVLVEFPGAAIAVPRLVDEHGRVQRNVAALPTLGSVAMEYLVGRIRDPYDLETLDRPVPVAACSGAALLIRRSDFDAVGGWDERYFMYVEDVELSYRMHERGRAIVYVPDAVLFHAEGGSSAEAGPLRQMLIDNRKDYLSRRLVQPRAALAVAAIEVGRRIAPLRNALLRLVRGRREQGVSP